MTFSLGIVVFVFFLHVSGECLSFSLHSWSLWVCALVKSNVEHCTLRRDETEGIVEEVG